MLEAKNVVKTFDGFRALDEASLTVPKGAVYGLVGPNGAGKSTIIRHFTGVYRPDSGSLTLEGQPIYENTTVKQRVCVIPDDWFYFSQWSIREMARLYKGMYPTFSQERYDKMCKKREDTEKALAALRTVHIPWQKVNQALHEDAIENGSMRAEDLLRRANVHYADLASVCEELPSLRDEVAEQVEITLKYEGYLQRQMRQVEEFRRTENVKIPEDIDYENITGLRIEARQKLSALRPETLGAAQRISGVSPGDIAVLMIKMEQMRREAKA